MIIIGLFGGQGNQMFQFSLYLILKKQKKAIILKNSVAQSMKILNRSTIFEAYVLDKDYNLNINKYDLRIRALFEKIIIKSFTLFNRRYIELDPSVFDNNIFNLNNYYIEGYWQSEKYFCNYRNEILSAFKLRKELDKKNQTYEKLILKAEISISIHFRFGDYTNEMNKAIYGDICNEEYYQNAIDYFNKNFSNPTFFIFSNEHELITKKFDIKNYFIINSNGEDKGYFDMYLMSICNHNIIANSSFSWWGAWLNLNPDKVVIAPLKWTNNENRQDICPKEWIRI
jgi:hypothetical protein